MKVRIGIALGQWPIRDLQPGAILELVDFFESLGVDSLWVSDRLVSAALTLEPITFLSFIAGRLRNMKLGTSTLVLPTRNPIVLAKELATLDFLSQ
ncbi:MAG TPA: LLM class flavin-dependent oxidoreductase, partial [Candidatus Binatus sp.]|nr:LLM class flavin-dependent oxidoreductase [Candidatus Binatus sp.]